jgi:nucleolin
MASSVVAASLRALAASTSASLQKPTATPSPFLVLLAPTPPRRPLGLRSARRLPLAPLAASDSFESSVGVDYAEPAAAESEQEEEEAFASGEEEEDAAAEASAAVEEEEVGEYVEPPEEAKVYVGNLPYDVDSERLAQLFEQAGVVEVSEVRPTVASASLIFTPCIKIASTETALGPLFCSGITFSRLV